MRSRGSDYAKGVNSGRWAAARESVDFGQSSGRASRVVSGIGRCGAVAKGAGGVVPSAEGSVVDGESREGGTARTSNPLRVKENKSV